MSDSVLSASAKGASFLILLQVGSRALTFIVNQVLLRYLSPELLGVSAQLELYSISVLYFARESLRVALQRQASGTQTVVNLAYVAVIIGVPLIYILGVLYLQTAAPDIPYLLRALQLYGVATLVELLSEPAFAAAQQKLLYGVRASAETAATIARCLATCGSAIWASRAGVDIGALPFGVGQMAYAMILLATYVNKLSVGDRQKDYTLLPKRLPSSQTAQYLLGYFSSPLSQLTFSLFIQSGIKYLLTQGDSIIITSLASLRDQGAYALAANYGGLIARMLFQPIEESSRNLFAKLCAASSPNEKPSKTNISQASTTFRVILKFYWLLSVVACSIGPSIAPLLLRIVAGSKWSDTGAGDTLATYCYYIPLLAVNGVTEAFVAAVASNAQLYTQSIQMTGFSVCYAAAAYLFLKVGGLGAQGLVYANCVNMALRILWGLNFVRKFFKSNDTNFDLLATLPSAYSIAASIAVPAVIRGTEGALVSYGLLGELVREGSIAGAFGLLLLYFERRYLVQCYQMVRSARSQPSKAK